MDSGAKAARQGAAPPSLRPQGQGGLRGGAGAYVTLPPGAAGA